MSEEIRLKNIEITSPFWQRYRDLIAKKAVPFQWKMISDSEQPEVTSDRVAGGASEKSGAIENLKIAAQEKEGHHQGMIFQDTDVYKWLETVAYVLRYQCSNELKTLADRVINLIGKAQASDGYLSTRYQIDTPSLKFRQLQQSHELYSMGHYIEAGVAYYNVTKNKQALEIAEKMADCIDRNFGDASDKIHGYDGHPEIELALTKLYDCTHNKKYLNLANYFVLVRGTEPDFFDKQNQLNDIKYDPFPEMRHAKNNYLFDERPIFDVKMVQGHAVRVLYYLTGAAHVARLKKDKKLLEAVKRLWTDITNKQMYITGNVGQTAAGEAFTYDYDLPNKTDYGETCASVAMIMLAKQLENSEFKGEYGDILERELYNGALTGISLDGEHYFYANPLEISNKSYLTPASSHLSNRRLSWFSCACCPANITRLIASIDQYIYAIKGDQILIDQLISNQTEFSDQVKIEVESQLPWYGKIKVKVSNPNKKSFDLAIRIPAWSKETSIKVNDTSIKTNIQNGIQYFKISEDYEISINLDMNVHLIHANARVSDDHGKVAIQRGPIIYCAEGIDNSGSYDEYQIPTPTDAESELDSKMLEGIVKVKIQNSIHTNETKLYTTKLEKDNEIRPLTLIPYYAWANRKPSSMSVWLNEEI